MTPTEKRALRAERPDASKRIMSCKSCADWKASYVSVSKERASLTQQVATLSEALREAELQIKHLDKVKGYRGTTNFTLAKIERALQSLEVKP